MKHTYLTLVLSIFSIIWILSQTHAWFVPWTIVRDSWTSPVQDCTNVGNDYRTGFSCSTAVCLTYNYWENSSCPWGCTEYNQVQSTCKTYNNDATCKTYGTTTITACFDDFWGLQPFDMWECTYEWHNWETLEVTDYSNCIAYNNDATCATWNYVNGTCKTYSSCRTASNGCQTWSQTTPSFTTSTYYDRNNNSTTYVLSDLISVPWNHAILWEDAWNQCITEADGTNHTPASRLRTSTCDTSNSSYYSTAWSNGVCNDFDSTNTYLDSNTVDQLWAGTFNKNVLETRSTCTVEWRYAELDNDGPIISTTYWSFQTDTSKWCNLNKYKWLSPFSWTYGSSTNVNTPWCEYYNNTDGQDLVDTFEITVEDVSGLSKVQVELWTCSAYYDFTSLQLDELINATNAANWVRSEYQTLVINSWTNTVYGKSGIVSLKTLFWKTRLDDCLGEWENYLKVTAEDAARDSDDAITLAANTTTLLDKSYAIRIDNSGPTFNVVSDYNFDPNYKEYPTSIFDSSFDSDSWYNETITWNFIMRDWVNKDETLCTQYIQSGTWTCTATPWKVWNAPVLADWTYAIYSCDGIEITDDSVCNFTCDAWYILSVDGSTCEPIPVTYDWYDEWYAGGCLAGNEYKVVSCADITDPNNTTNISACNMTNLKSSLAPWEAIYDEASLTGTEWTLSVYKSCSNPFILWTSELGWFDTLGN
jgi:hypothetical protein